MKEYQLKGKVKITISVKTNIKGEKSAKDLTTKPSKQGHIAAVEYLSLSSWMKIFLFPRIIPKTISDIL